MPEPINLSLIQFLDWVASQPRSYGEAMDAWRTSCPRLSVWEDAIGDGLVRLDGSDAGGMRESAVRLTARGRTLLNAQQASADGRTPHFVKA